jgi:hypothetical protein
MSEKNEIEDGPERDTSQRNLVDRDRIGGDGGQVGVRTDGHDRVVAVQMKNRMRGE